MLDIGTGTGVFAEAFAALGIAVTGIDVNADLLAAARHLVAILEWPYRSETIGPPLEHRVKPETISALVVSAGYLKTESVHLDHKVTKNDCTPN